MHCYYMSPIEPIRAKVDYQATLTRIESIFHATPGTAEFDELDLLTTAVQAYDAVHYPIPEPAASY